MNAKHKLLSRIRGFSLIELVITLAVAAILLFAGAPLMSDWIASLRIRTASESVLNGIQLARMEAIRRNARVSFWLVSSTGTDCAESAGSTSWVVSNGDISTITDKCANTDVNLIVQRRSGAEGSQGVSIVSATGTGCLVFDGFGRLATPAQAYCATPITQLAFSTDSGAGRGLQVRVTPAGGVRMCDPSAGNDDPRRC